MTSKAAAMFAAPPKWLAVLLIPAFVFCVYRITHGYGGDNDTYLMLGTWQTMLLDGRYIASRFQGNIVAEFAIGFLSSLTGAPGSNTLIFICSVVSVVFLYTLLKRHNIKFPELIFIAYFTNIYVLITSATSIDYHIASVLFLSGLYFLDRNKIVCAIVLFSFAAGTRIQYFPLSALVGIYYAYRASGRIDRAFAGSASGFVIALFLFSGVFYLPVWISNSLTFEWLASSRPVSQGIFGLGARFIYKTLFVFLGAISVIFLAIGLALERRKLFSRPDSAKKQTLSDVALIVFIYNTALFFYIPVEASYLMPSLLFGAVWLLCRGMTTTIVLLSLGQLISACIMIDVLKIDRPSSDPCAGVEASGARIALSVRPGPAIEEIQKLPTEDTCNLRFLRMPYASPNAPLPPSIFAPRSPAPTHGGR